MLVTVSSFPGKNLCKNITFNENATCYSASLFVIWILMKFAQQDLFRQQLEMCGGREMKVGWMWRKHIFPQLTWSFRQRTRKIKLFSLSEATENTHTWVRKHNAALPQMFVCTEKFKAKVNNEYTNSSLACRLNAHALCYCCFSHRIWLEVNSDTQFCIWDCTIYCFAGVFS